MRYVWLIMIISFFCNKVNSQEVLSLGHIIYNISYCGNNQDCTPCIDKVKVGDNRPSSCTFGDVWYPVINEQFNTNHLGELLNNYSFRTEFSDIFDNQYYGDVFNLNTAFLNNGELVLDIKKGNFPGGTSFATALLRSLYKTRLGIYKAKVKFPNNIYTWPSVWLQYGSVANQDYEEIDWCEFFDNCPAKDNWLCHKGGRFSWMRMNIITCRFQLEVQQIIFKGVVQI
ncbi:MAG: hypothetical protein Fur0023_10710 [Bacteroidia bacterium]